MKSDVGNCLAASAGGNKGLFSLGMWAGVRVTCQVNHQTEVCCHEVHRRVMFKI